MYAMPTPRGCATIFPNVVRQVEQALRRGALRVDTNRARPIQIVRTAVVPGLIDIRMTCQVLFTPGIDPAVDASASIFLRNAMTH